MDYLYQTVPDKQSVLAYQPSVRQDSVCSPDVWFEEAYLFGKEAANSLDLSTELCDMLCWHTQTGRHRVPRILKAKEHSDQIASNRENPSTLLP